MTTGVDKLKVVESIRGIPIDKLTFNYLENYVKEHGILGVIVGSASSFSKPMQFFRDKKKEYQYLQKGVLVPYEKLQGKEFIGFKIVEKNMYVFGFFPGEY